jgi:parallel beta-helix repeat protein
MKELIVITIIGLFLGVAVAPSITAQDVTLEAKPLRDGNTWYVGGTGPGNYTRIQDAIDNASNNDAVFIYRGNYEENLRINNPLTLIGENKNDTQISGGGLSSDGIIEIKASYVSIINLTIGDDYYRSSISAPYVSGFQNIRIKVCNIIKSNDGIEGSNLKNCVITNCHIMGISATGIQFSNISNLTIESCKILNELSSSEWNGISISNGWDGCIDEIIINNCEIINWNGGILILDQFDNVTISNNYITEIERVGLQLSGSSIDNVSKNLMVVNNVLHIKEYDNISTTGIYLRNCKGFRFEQNEIKNSNLIGLFLQRCIIGEVINNNFINNSKDAFFTNMANVHWDNNYWDDCIGIKIPILGFLPKIIFGRLNTYFLRFVFDLHPAQAPYDIG